MNREGANPTWDSKNGWVQGGAMVAFAYVTKAGRAWNPLIKARK
ncbi:MAG: hypothetical protein ACPL4E_06900 [Thermoproteota archaeon]